MNASKRSPGGEAIPEEVTNKIHCVDLAEVKMENIRNFSIVAHIDHGKSTLADRILEVVGAIPTSKDNKQILDKLQGFRILFTFVKCFLFICILFFN